MEKLIFLSDQSIPKRAIVNSGITFETLLDIEGAFDMDNVTFIATERAFHV